MLSITIPLWMSIAAAAIPTLALMWVVVKLARALHRSKADVHQTAVVAPKPAQFGPEIMQQLFEQQIDAVFQSLSTIIETEQTKLKALARGWGLVPMDTQEPKPKVDTIMTEPAICEQNLSHQKLIDTSDGDDDISQKIAECLEGRMTEEETARRLDLSVAEVVLAMRMRQGRSAGQNTGRRLEAVA